jgi:hypothetical protein
MTKEEVIAWAVEAGFVVDEKAKEHQPNCIFHTHYMVDELLERFASLVAAATAKEYEARLRFTRERWEIECRSQVEIEREACAKVCEEIAIDMWNLYKGRPPYKGDEEGRASEFTQGRSAGADACGDAIRARSNT